MIQKNIRLIALVLLLVSSIAFAGSGLPICSDGKREIPVINTDVIQWKATTPNQYRARAHVRGTVTRMFPDRNGHTHFEIQMDAKTSGAAGLLEVVYNDEFGKLPVIEEKADIESCGVYITSNAPTERYPASPSGAIIHWIHINPSKRGEPDGYLAIQGKVYGDQLPPKQKPPKR